MRVPKWFAGIRTKISDFWETIRAERDYEDLRQITYYLKHLQIGTIVLAILVWVATVYGPLTGSLYFIFAAIAGLLASGGGVVAHKANRVGEDRLIPGEAGVFNALAGAGRPMTPEELSIHLPLTAKEIQHRLGRLEEEGHVRSEEYRNAKRYRIAPIEEMSQDHVNADSTKKDSTGGSTDRTEREEEMS